MQQPPGYPPGGGGYPPGGGGPGRPPGPYGAPQPPQSQGGYGPPQAPGGAYGPAQPGGPGGYGPPQGGPPQGGYGPPQAGGYGPPQAGGYGPPQAGGYGPPQAGGYGPPQAGGPAGYGPPQGAWGPGHAQPPGMGAQGAKDSPNVALIALIAVVVVVVSSFGGCLFCAAIAGSDAAQTAADTTASDPGKSETTTGAGSGGWITSERPYVKFLAPPGWKQEIKSDWAIFESADGTATLAFTTFDKPNESTAKLGRAAWALGVSDIAWGSPSVGTVGQEAMSARIGDGRCNYKGPGGYIEYATVNPGGSDQILLIYAVTASASKLRKEEAQVAIKSLQRR